MTRLEMPCHDQSRVYPKTTFARMSLLVHPRAGAATGRCGRPAGTCARARRGRRSYTSMGGSAARSATATATREARPGRTADAGMGSAGPAARQAPLRLQRPADRGARTAVTPGRGAGVGRARTGRGPDQEQRRPGQPRGRRPRVLQLVAGPGGAPRAEPVPVAGRLHAHGAASTPPGLTSRPGRRRPRWPRSEGRSRRVTCLPWRCTVTSTVPCGTWASWRPPRPARPRSRVAGSGDQCVCRRDRRFAANGSSKRPPNRREPRPPPTRTTNTTERSGVKIRPRTETAFVG